MSNKNLIQVSSVFRKGHRTLGLTVIPLIVILLLTGILLNHSEDLDLDSVPLSYGLLKLVYGVQTDEELVGFLVEGYWLTVYRNRLILNSTPFTECSQPLKGAVMKGGFFIALCSDSLVFVTPQGQLVERVGPSHGLPQPLQQIGSNGDADVIFLADSIDKWKLNLANLQKTKITAAHELINWSKPANYPKELLEEVSTHLIIDDINLERLILDIHSGRVLGTVGVFLADFAAVLMAMLAISGFLMWVRKR